MLNQVVLVGRLVDNPEVIKVSEDKKEAIIEIACPRPFKNTDGEYETDYIKCYLWNAIASNTAEYCSKGDIVGIKGRIQTDENKEIKLIAEKVTFLNSNKKGE